MMDLLYQKGVITDDDSKKIDNKIGKEKMRYLIAEIIIRSLKSKHSEKYKYFLQSMEESEDIDLKNTAEELGKLSQHSLFCPFGLLGRP